MIAADMAAVAPGKRLVGSFGLLDAFSEDQNALIGIELSDQADSTVDSGRGQIVQRLSFPGETEESSGIVYRGMRCLAGDVPDGGKESETV